MKINTLLLISTLMTIVVLTFEVIYLNRKLSNLEKRIETLEDIEGVEFGTITFEE